MLYQRHDVRRFLLGLISAVAAACSSPGITPEPDAGADAGPSNTLKCGAGGLTGAISFKDVTNIFEPIAGVKVTGPGCNTVTTDETGTIQADLAPGQLLKLVCSASGYVTEEGEATPQASGFDRQVYLAPTSLTASLLPGWTTGDGYAVVSIAPSASGTGPCATADGLVVSVNGHPEITVGYMSDLTTRSAALTATNALGLAVVGPIPPGQYEFDATKAGCTAGPDHGKYFLWPQTVDVDADALSFVQLALP